MKETALFTITTTMESDDYRKFLYLATFRKKPFTIPMILAVAAIGALLATQTNPADDIIRFLLIWMFMLALTVAIICFKVEYKHRQRIKTDKTGAFGTSQTIKFYEDYLRSTNQSVESKNKMRYDQFYKIIETKNYFILYYNANMASLIRKKDMTCEKELRGFLKNKFSKNYGKI